MEVLASPASFENIASRANACAISASLARAASGPSADPVAGPTASHFVLRKGGSTDPIILIAPIDIRT